MNEEYKNPLINKAIKYMKYIINSKYDQYVLSQIAEQAARNELQEAREKAMQQGMQQGVQQGVQQEKIEIAKNMLKQGSDLNFIKICTGLNIQEIESLRVRIEKLYSYPFKEDYKSI